MYLLAQLPADQLSEQIKNGLILLVLGMAIVFVFLTILVFSTKLVSKLVRKFEKSPAPAAATTVVQPTVTQPVAKASNDAEVAAAIAAAVAKSKK